MTYNPTPYENRYKNPTEAWQRAYNLVDSKVWYLSQIAYIKANQKKDGTWYKKHRPYEVGEEVHTMTKMLGELPGSSAERIEEMAAYATQYKIQYQIYG